jgi:hypothetical protein
MGLHLNSNGSVIFGASVQSVMQDSEVNISVDYLSRVLVDLHEDTAKTTESLLCLPQQRMLKTIFRGTSGCRYHFNSFTTIVCAAMTPDLPAAGMLDSESKEKEIKQILGDIAGAFDLADGSLFILGKEGMLFKGAHWAQSQLVIEIAKLQAKCIFVSNVGMFILVLLPHIHFSETHHSYYARQHTAIGPLTAC